MLPHDRSNPRDKQKIFYYITINWHISLPRPILNITKYTEEKTSKVLQNEGKKKIANMQKKQQTETLNDEKNIKLSSAKTKVKNKKKDRKNFSFKKF